MRNKVFAKSPTKELPKVFNDLLPKAKKYTNAEEVGNKRVRNHPQKGEVHAKTTGKKEPDLKEHTPIHAIEKIKVKRSSREGKNAIKAVAKSIQTTSKKQT